LREDFNRTMGNKVETVNSGNVLYGDTIWQSKTDVYEKGYVVNFSLDFEIINPTNNNT